TERASTQTWHSPVGSLMAQFIEEKQACGFSYLTESRILGRFDRFLKDHGLSEPVLPRDLVERWVVKRPHESKATQQLRFGLTCRFATFLIHHGYAAYVPDSHRMPKGGSRFVPRIFTHDEIRRLFQAADTLPYDPRTPWRNQVVPELFRLLYNCGLRVGEALHLHVADVDLEAGVLTIHQGKFRKDRLVPLAPALTQRLQHYVGVIGNRSAEAIFFPAPHGGAYHRGRIYQIYRHLLWLAHIPHGGPGQGPRLHDVRHTFAVHRLEKWYREGIDLQAKLPVLATYMGHLNLNGTQRYLQLTAELFPELSMRLDAVYGDLIPRRTQP
ncbi:MAG: integrase, partial [Candidatus Entotheonella gemina]